jgi:cell wall-associated NlpC family hydrolase
MEGLMLISYARSFIGTPYIWGGNSPDGYDCSGLVQECLAFVGCDPVGDQTAQTLFNHFSRNGTVTELRPGAVVFFGSSTRAISHVSLGTSEHTIIEAGGGDSTCITVEVANRKGAFVRERPITHRKDIVAILMPVYPDWAFKGDL